MTPEIWVAIVSTAGLVVVALIANRTRQHAKAARNQVENDHDTNLRVENDTRHTENVGTLESILRSQRAIHSTQKGIKADIRQIRTIVDRHAEQIWELEKTQPRPGRRKTT